MFQVIATSLGLHSETLATRRICPLALS